MRVFVANLVLALGLSILSAPGLALAQGGSAQDRLEAAASALEGVQSMRFSGQTNVTPASTGEPVKVFGGRGEFQSPDRGRMTVEQPLLSQVNETISVGQLSWLQTVDGSAWVPLPASAAPPAPRSIADQLRQVSRYMVSPTVNEDDTQMTISASVDLARAVSEESPIAATIGVGFTGDTDQGSLINDSRVVITIDRSSGLPLSLDTSLAMVPGAPPEGFPAGQLTITTSLTLTDFNSPEVVIRAPGE